MNDGPIVRRISFDIHGEFITQLAREWFYTGEKSHEKVIEILMDSMTGTDTPEAQIRRYAEDILLGRAALKGSTAAGTYHLETYEPGEEEQMPQSMNIWKEVERRKKAEKDLRRMIERWDVAMDNISESTQREIRKELGEETAEDRQQDALDSFMARIPNLGKCPFHQKGQVLYSDGINPVSKPEWVWNLTHQAHALGIPVFIKEDLLPIMGEAQMVQEFPPAFYRVLEEQKTWQK